MIGGLVALSNCLEREKNRCDLAGEELKQRKLDYYKETCLRLEKNNLNASGAKPNHYLLNAVLNYYDLSVKNKKIKVLPSLQEKDNKSPEGLISIIEKMWEGIEVPKGLFLEIPTNFKRDLLSYEAVRLELSNNLVKSAHSDPFKKGIIGAFGGAYLIFNGIMWGMDAHNITISNPLAYASTLGIAGIVSY